LVAVSGVLQDPSTYSVSGTTLTFSAAPPSGTGNISVRFLGIPASNIATTAYRTITEFTATSGQTTFSPASYTVGFINVYRNGVLLGTADYTATNGTTVVLAVGATSGDLITTEGFYVSGMIEGIPAVGGSVIGSYIADGAITTAKIADSNVTTAKILDANVTPAKLSQPLTSGTAVTASGTAVDFTGIPSWVKRITVMFSEMSVSGTSIPLVRLGTSSGVEATGYLASSGVIISGTGDTTNTTGFPIFMNQAAARLSGSIIFSLLNSSTNTWVGQGVVGSTTTQACIMTGGTKSLSAVIDRVRITTANGTDTFDSGTINILYE
jgi:hypothetical protein